MAEDVYSDMVCTCDDGRRAAAAALRERVREQLAAAYPDEPVTDRNFVSRLVDSLHFRLGVTDVRIYADQWFLVATEVAGFSTSVACDAVEDGLAATWAAYAARAEGRAPDRMDV